MIKIKVPRLTLLTYRAAGGQMEILENLLKMICSYTQICGSEKMYCMFYPTIFGTGIVPAKSAVQIWYYSWLLLEKDGWGIHIL